MTPEDIEVTRQARKDIRVGLAIGFAMCLASGNVYAFGAYSVEMKKRLGLDQHQVETLGMALHLGLYLFKPVAGMSYDRFGPRVTSFMAAIFSAIGFITIGLLSSKEAHGENRLLFGLFFAFLVLGFGSGLGYVTALSTNAKNATTQTRGLVVGAMASGFGISATIVSVIFVQGLSSIPTAKKLPLFFIILAVLMAIIDVLGALLLKRVTPPAVPETKAKMTSSKPAKLEEGEEGVEDADEEEPVTRKPTKSGSHHFSKSQIVPAGAVSEDVEKVLLPQHDVSDGYDWTAQPVGMIQAILHLIRDFKFWKIYVTFCIGTGCGLYLINNIGSMDEALSGDDNGKAVQVLVVTLALSNCVGRLALGAASDRLPTPRHWIVSACLLVMSAVTFGASFISFHLNTHFTPLYVPVVMVGFAYGGVWALIPTILSETYGMNNFGKVFGITCTAPAISSVIYNQMAGHIYEHYTAAGKSTCYGVDCFKGSLLFASALTLVGGLGSAFVWRNEVKGTSTGGGH